MFNLNRYIKAVFELQKTFFAIYLKRDYLEHYYVHEKKIHLLHKKILALINKLPDQDKKIAQRLHELVIAQGFLRFRVKDFATFEIIDKELKELFDVGADFATATEKINALEDIYHTTLQVVAPDPLVFYIFIQTLKDFYQELKNFKVVLHA